MENPDIRPTWTATDINLAYAAHPILRELSPAGKIALAICLIQQVAAAVPEKPVSVILADLGKILMSPLPTSRGDIA
jgi:hypothetical protein